LNKECKFALLLKSVCREKKLPKFSKKYPASTVPNKGTVFRIAKNFSMEV
jgi:hypothetical protein